MNSTHCDNPACDSWVHGDPPEVFAFVRRDDEIFCKQKCADAVRGKVVLAG